MPAYVAHMRYARTAALLTSVFSAGITLGYGAVPAQVTRALSSLAGTRNGLIPYRSWASRACGEYFTVSIIFALTPPSDTA